MYEYFLSIPSELCGKTDYHLDVYETGRCQYMKCAAECTDGAFEVEYDGMTYVRQRTCCQGDYCNRESPIVGGQWSVRWPALGHAHTRTHDDSPPLPLCYPPPPSFLLFDSPLLPAAHRTAPSTLTALVAGAAAIAAYALL